jgi:hypothetical protein
MGFGTAPSIEDRAWVSTNLVGTLPYLCATHCVRFQHRSCSHRSRAEFYSGRVISLPLLYL